MPDKKNGVGLKDIYDLLDRTSGSVGRVEGRMDGLESNVALMRQAVQDHGTAIGALQQTCSARGDTYEQRFKRLSGTVATVEEVTGVHHMDDLKRKAQWSLARKIGAAVIALATAVGGVIGALKVFG